MSDWANAGVMSPSNMAPSAMRKVRHDNTLYNIGEGERIYAEGHDLDSKFQDVSIVTPSKGSKNSRAAVIKGVSVGTSGKYR